MDRGIEELLAERAIRTVLYRYCRGIDHHDADLIRSCYCPDAVDDHGTYVGGVEGFIEHALGELQRYERTMHMIGNVLIDVGTSEATCESYVLSYHRLPARKVPYERDFLVALATWTASGSTTVSGKSTGGRASMSGLVSIASRIHSNFRERTARPRPWIRSTSSAHECA